MTTTDDFEFDELDELAAAYVDGAATPEEITRVESDPDLQARVEEFREMAELVAEPVTPPPDATRDAAIAAAVAAFETPVSKKRDPIGTNEIDQTDSPIAGAPPGELELFSRPKDDGDPPISSLDAARARRRARLGSRVGTIAKVAAAIMVVFLGLTVITQAFDGTSDEIASVDTVSDAASDAAGDVADAVTDSAESAADDGAANAVTGDDSEAMAEDDAMEEEAMEEEAMEEAEPEPAIVDETAPASAADEVGENNAAGTADTDRADADESKADAEAEIAIDGSAALRYLLPDQQVAERADYIGTFDSVDEFIVDYRPATEGMARQFVIPNDFSACDLSTLLPAPRALLYVGTTTIAGDQLLVGLEPGDDGDRIIVFGLNDSGDCDVTLQSLLPTQN